MKNDSEYKLLIGIAELYYNGNYTQSEIAQRYHISRPKVSRLLAESKELGIVKIFIDNKANSTSYLEDRLMERFDLKAVKVVSVPDYDPHLAMQMTSQAAAGFFAGFLEPGDHIGVSWGYTLYTLVKYFLDLTFETTHIYQLTGNVDNTNTHSRAGEIVSILAQKLHTSHAYTLPCPAMLDSNIIVDMMMHDTKIKWLYDMACSCNKLIINLAPANESCCLYKANYISDRNLATLREAHVAGSICCRFIDIDGNLCDENLDSRTFGIPLSEIKNKEYVMTCVASAEKAPVLLAALKANYVNILTIDSVSAELLLSMT